MRGRERRASHRVAHREKYPGTLSYIRSIPECKLSLTTRRIAARRDWRVSWWPSCEPSSYASWRSSCERALYVLSSLCAWALCEPLLRLSHGGGAPERARDGQPPPAYPPGRQRPAHHTRHSALRSCRWPVSAAHHTPGRAS